MSKKQQTATIYVARSGKYYVGIFKTRPTFALKPTWIGKKVGARHEPAELVETYLRKEQYRAATGESVRYGEVKAIRITLNADGRNKGRRFSLENSYMDGLTLKAGKKELGVFCVTGFNDVTGFDLPNKKWRLDATDTTPVAVRVL